MAARYRHNSARSWPYAAPACTSPAVEADVGEAIRRQSLDASSAGVRRQAELRDSAAAKHGYAESFILSGYPHADEGDLFARHVLPQLAHGPLFGPDRPD